jgi:pimeloyl-ACP methyl ester carboxylesterase
MYARIKAYLPGLFFDRAKGLAYAAKMPPGSFHADVAKALMGEQNTRSANAAGFGNLEPGLRGLKRPVLIILGYQDPIGQRPVQQIHQWIRSSLLRYNPQCGHYPWIEQPEKFRSVLSEFLISTNSPE